jgi:hypothetical protein
LLRVPLPVFLIALLGVHLLHYQFWFHSQRSKAAPGLWSGCAVTPVTTVCITGRTTAISRQEPRRRFHLLGQCKPAEEREPVTLWGDTPVSSFDPPAVFLVALALGRCPGDHSWWDKLRLWWMSQPAGGRRMCQNSLAEEDGRREVARG